MPDPTKYQSTAQTSAFKRQLLEEASFAKQLEARRIQHQKGLEQADAWMARRTEERSRALEDVGRTGYQVLADAPASLARGATRYAAGMAQMAVEGLPTVMGQHPALAPMAQVLDPAIQAAQGHALSGIHEGASSVDEALAARMGRVSQAAERNYQTDAAQQAEASMAQYEQEIADGRNDAWAQTRMLGRDIRDSAGNILNHPTQLANMVVEEVPALLAAGPLSRGSATASQVRNRMDRLADEALERSTRSGAALPAVEELARRARAQVEQRNALGVVAGMEASGSYNETYAQTMDTPIEELARENPRVQEMLASGMDPELVKQTLARERASIASGAVMALGPALARISPAFELAPLRAGTPGQHLAHRAASIPATLLAEGAEEAGFGFVGSTAGNVAARMTGDEGTVLMEGVGAEVGTGAVVGSTMAGAFQTPAAHGVMAQGAGMVTTQGLRLFRERAEQAREMAEAPAEETRQRAVQETVRAVQGLDTITTRMKEEASVPDDLTGAAEAEPLVQKETTEKLGLDSTGSSLSLLGQVLTTLQNPETPEEHRGELALFALKKARELRHYAHNELAQKVEEDPERYGELKGLIEGLVTNPLVTQIETMVEGLSQEDLDAEFQALPEKPVALADLKPQDQAVIARAVELAYAAPEKVSSEQVSRILYQESQLPARDVEQLKLVRDLAQIRESYAAKTEELRNRKVPTQDIVSQRIQETGWELGGDELRSIADFTREIAKAAAVGDRVSTTQLMEGLHRFSTHMATKAQRFNAALDQSWNTGNQEVKIPEYKQLNNEGGLSDKVAWVKANVAGSRGLVEAINADAEVAVNTFNLLRNQYNNLVEASLEPLSLPQPVTLTTKPTQEAKETTLAQSPDAESAPATGDAAPAAVWADEQPAQQEEAVPPAEEPGREQAPEQQEAVAESEPTEQGEERSEPRSDESVDESETEQEKATTSTERELPSKLEERFPNLPRTMGEVTKDTPAEEGYLRRNKFLAAFKHRKKAKGFLARFPSLETVREALRRVRETEDNTPLRDLYTDEDAYLAPGSHLAHVYQDLFEKKIPTLVRHLNRSLNHRLKGQTKTGAQGKKHDGKLSDAAGKLGIRFRNGDYLTWNFQNAMTLAVTETLENGEVRYPEEIGEAMMTAAFHWLLKLQKQPVIVDMEAMDQTYGDKISEEVRGMMLNQHYLPNYVEELGRDIMELLGLQGRDDFSVNWTEGLPMVLAMDAINILQTEGYLDITKGHLLDENGDKSEVYLSFLNLTTAKRSNEVEQFLTDLGPDKEEVRLERLTRLLYPERRDLGHLGEPSSTLRDTIDRSFQLLAPQQKAAVKARQNTAHYVNEGFANFISALGFKNFLSLRNKIDPDDLNPDAPVYNETHEEVLKGIFRGIKASYDSLQEVYGNIQAYALVNRQPDVSQVPVYYEAKMLGNGRISYVQAFNQQSDKLARETITSVRTTLDMTDDANRAEYFLALAQMLGKKVEKAQKEGLDLTAADVIKRELDGKYAPVVAAFQDFIRDPSGDNSQRIHDRLKDLKPEWAEIELHALWDYANLQLAPDPKNYTTHVYLEIDGISNGMINGLVLMGMHSLDGTMVKQLRQGGVFLGSHANGNITDQHIAHERNNQKLGGLYENVGARFKAWAQSYHEDLVDEGDKKIFRAGIHLMEAINYLSVKELGELIVLNEVERAPGKAMLMPTVYGSGAKSLIKLIAQTIMDKTYQEMSQGLANNEPLSDLKLAALKRMIPTLDVESLKDPRNYRKFQFTQEQLRALTKNLQGTRKQPQAGTALVEAAQDELAPVLDAFRHVIALSGAKSYLFARAYKKAYEDLRQQRVEEGKLGPYEALSRKDEAAVHEKVKHLAPIVQTLHSQGTEGAGLDISKVTRNGLFTVPNRKGKQVPVELRSIMGGDIHMNLPARQIEAPGVRAVALSVQALGDATMMAILEQVFAGETNQVYDGWNVSPGRFQELGPKANEAVLQSYQYNALQAVYEGMRFDYSLLEELNEQEFKELLEFLKPDELKGKTFQEQRSFIIHKLEIHDISLDRAAEINSAVQKVVFGGGVQSSIDQMAGPKTPAQTPGKELTGTDEEIAAAIQKEARSQVQTQTGAELKAALKKTPFKNKLHRAIYSRIERLLPDDLQIHIGSAEAIQAKQKELVPGEDIKPAAGVTVGKQVFISEYSQATLLHELVHASTMHLVNGYFAKTGKLNTTQMAAVKRLEILARDFVERDLGNHPAQTVVRNLLDSGRRADAVNEFVAWSLTTPELAQRLWKEEPNGLLRKMAARARDFIRQLLGMEKTAEVENFLSQTIDQFHKLTNSARMVEYDADGSILYQDGSTAQQERLEQFRRITSMVDIRSPMQLLNAQESLADAKLQSEEVQRSLVQAGFDLSPDQQELFESWHALMTAEIDLDPGVMIGYQSLYDAARQQLGWEDFLDVPDTSDPQSIATAHAQYDAVFDTDGNQLAVFVALAQADEGFRAKLKDLKLPKNQTQSRNFDDLLRNFAEKSLDALNGKVLGLETNSSLEANLQHLTKRLVEAQTRAQKRRERAPSVLDHGENLLLQQLDKADNWATKKLQERADKRKAKQTVKMDGWIDGLLMTVQGLTSDTGAQAFGNAVLSLANQKHVPTWITELASELVGNTGGVEAPLVALLTKSRAMVSRARQRLRVEGADRIRQLFATDLNEADWKQLHRTVVDADLSALLGGYSLRQIKRLVESDSARATAIAKLESQLGPNQALYTQAAEDLAHWMMKKENVSKGFLYSNAEAMAQLLGTGVKVEPEQARKLVPLLDRLTTLKALEHLSESERDFLVERLEKDGEGMERTMQLLSHLAQAERTKPHADKQQFNYWKGYAPVSNDPRSNLVLADSTRGKQLLKLGYRKVSDYVGDANDNQKDLAYYAINMAGNKASYTQGALQIVEGTINGVDQFTGQSLAPHLSTRITDRRTVNLITANKKAGRGTGKYNLRPIFNEKGEVYAYERVVEAGLIDQHMKFKPDLAESIGSWLGRQTEELIAREINTQAIQAMKKAWDQEKSTRADEYVDISNSKDKVIQESWNSLPREVQKELKTVFGPKVMVRRNLVNMSVGYRSASTEDIFTGMSRMHPEVRKKLETAAYGLLGKDAAKYLKVAEQGVESLVRTAADFIVVRSLRVAYINLMANQFQLLSSGIPLTQLISGQLRKTREAMVYLRNEKRINQLVIDIASETHPLKRRELENEQQRLRQANQRLSIMPLIEAGEMTTITEGLSEVDDYTFASDFAGWLRKKTQDMPKELTTVGKYALMSKDTALYQGVNRTIQLGDFVAKAMMYDHKMQREGKDAETALREVNETFVNYNLPAGRTRDWFNKVGLTWFWHYKIRMQKIILRTARNNPLRFLLGNLGAEVSGVDSLMDTNAVFNNWEYSMGPGQGLRAHELLYWRQLFGI